MAIESKALSVTVSCIGDVWRFSIVDMHCKKGFFAVQWMSDFLYSSEKSAVRDAVCAFRLYSENKRAIAKRKFHLKSSGGF